MDIDPLLRVRDLAVTIAAGNGTAQVLDGVTLDVGRGEIVGLVGESGCGKTTLARAVLGVLPGSARVRSGMITFADKDLLRMPRAELARDIQGRAITFIPQDPYSSLSPLFTVGDQIGELMKWRSPLGKDGKTRLSKSERQSRDRERTLALLQAVQLPDPVQLLKKYPHELSGGQRQRLMIAMALLPEPAMVIADEPTTALDVTIQAQILKMLRTMVRERNVSVLFTTHDFGTAYEICDRVTVMYAGQEVESADIASFFARPAHPYTWSLLRSIPAGRRLPDGIRGEVPSLLRPPGGCRFHPRCAAADDDCRVRRPPSEVLTAAHRVRCFHKVEQMPSERQAQR
ncbi:MAG: ABC transporter ATP-binding protein [Alphaproteobacteria bacterium]|nr:ABC transporter ATP-binding protein [Alphaproteobacteria bacterium]